MGWGGGSFGNGEVGGKEKRKGKIMLFRACASTCYKKKSIDFRTRSTKGKGLGEKKKRKKREKEISCQKVKGSLGFFFSSSGASSVWM